ncbi:hypothetical protein SAMN04488128_104312 [Chitinophaga eiseniae]|uniref:Uncharacterized protein n=2 Tax=Chitinophaga eiseniae TaxID=634771 RepID=A0A1T4TBQ4_9BACT|nr:hypothetical protein SAMN04488128_104312 [Chitinophaga eiseniae]
MIYPSPLLRGIPISHGGSPSISFPYEAQELAIWGDLLGASPACQRPPDTTTAHFYGDEDMKKYLPGMRKMVPGNYCRQCPDTGR